MKLAFFDILVFVALCSRCVMSLQEKCEPIEVDFCLKQHGGGGVIFAHPNNCQCFIICSLFGDFVFNCPGDELYFDPDTAPFICRWPWELTCERQLQCNLTLSDKCTVTTPVVESSTAAATAESVLSTEKAIFFSETTLQEETGTQSTEFETGTTQLPLSVCHVELHSWCNSDSNHDGFICLNGTVVLNTTSTSNAECDLYLGVISVDTCSLSNVTSLNISNPNTTAEDLLQFLSEQAESAVISIVTTCDVRTTPALRSALSAFGIPVPFDYLYVKLAAVLQKGGPSNSTYLLAECGTEEGAKLCTDVTVDQYVPCTPC